MTAARHNRTRRALLGAAVFAPLLAAPDPLRLRRRPGGAGGGARLPGRVPALRGPPQRPRRRSRTSPQTPAPHAGAGPARSRAEDRAHHRRGGGDARGRRAVPGGAEGGWVEAGAFSELGIVSPELARPYQPFPNGRRSENRDFLTFFVAVRSWQHNLTARPDISVKALNLNVTEEVPNARHKVGCV
jgi:hypothetical protein